jgi:hypothetical protein
MWLKEIILFLFSCIPISPSPSEARAAFLGRLTRRVDGLLPMSVINKRRCKSQLSGATPRRSRRIAGAGVEFILDDLGRRTKKKAMRALDILDETEGISQQAQDDYAKLFRHPLSDSHVQALAALFNWSLPDVFGQGDDGELLA